MVPRRPFAFRFTRQRRGPALTVRAGLALVVVTLALSSLSTVPASASGATPPVIRASEEKQRVPKPPPEQPRTKPDPNATGSSSSGSSSSGDGDGDQSMVEECIGACFSGCVDGFFESVFAAVFHPQHKAALVDTAAAGDSLARLSMVALGDSTGSSFEADVPHAWSRLDVGYLWTQFPEDSVVLRRSPSDPDSILMEAGRLPADERVLVMSVRTTGGGTMVEIRPVDRSGPAGWVHEKSLGVEPRWSAATDSLAGIPADSLAAPSALMTAAPPPPPTKEQVRQQKLALMQKHIDTDRQAFAFAIGGSGLTNDRLKEEYATGATCSELNYTRFLKARPWTVGVAAGYRQYFGKPVVEYVGATETDVPSDSRFATVFGSLEVGHRFAFASGPRFGYSIGPALAHVHEHADVLVLDNGTQLPVASRVESLNRWAGGATATAWFGWRDMFPLEGAIRVRVLTLYWKGLREKSLTTDYTDEALTHVDASLVFTLTTH